jgi:Transposase DNA-binding/Transposase Tn5 dimerisation domain
METPLGYGEPAMSSTPSTVVDTACAAWAAKIASFADLPDERLDARLATTLATLAAKPASSIPQAAGDWQKAKPIYRFFANERISDAKLLQPIAAATAADARGQAVIYAVQDTTSFNYSHLKQTAGLGLLNDSPTARGLHWHSTLALGCDGVPFGLLDRQWWIRPPGQRHAKNHKRRRLERKESMKWLRGIRASQAVLEGLPPEQRPRLVHVMDREGDIHEVLETISAGPDSAVIRCVHDRKVDSPSGYTHAAIRSTTPLGTKTLALPRSHGQAARKATVEMRATSLTIMPNRKKHSQRREVVWTLVEVWEPQPPAGTEGLHWLLWTREPAATLDQAWAVVIIYTYRWRIEEYHLVLKSGCHAEKLELESGVRLAKALTLYAAIAVRIVALRDLAKRAPDQPCTQVLHEDEWRALWSHINRKPCVANTPVPTIRQAVMWIGRLGGHLGRKRDGLPGVRTLWRGMRDLTLLVAGYRAGQRRE